MVSGALDRLHYEKDPCVKYDVNRKLWIYLHRSRTEDEFGEFNSGALLLRLRFLTAVPSQAPICFEYFLVICVVQSDIHKGVWQGSQPPISHHFAGQIPHLPPFLRICLPPISPPINLYDQLSTPHFLPPPSVMFCFLFTVMNPHMYVRAYVRLRALVCSGSTLQSKML